MKNTIVLIHGAGASPSCWNYIDSKILTSFDVIRLSYDINKNNLQQIVEGFTKKLKEIDGELIIIGHSLGGIIGFDIASRLENKVSKLITVSSPFNGLDLNLFIKSILIMKVPSIIDIFRNSAYIKKLAKSHITAQWTMVKTKNAGFGIFFNEDNDGVLTYRDQTNKCFKQKRKEIDIVASHLEVLLNKDLVDIITEQLT